MSGLTRSLVLGDGASGVSIAPADLPTASIPAGTFLRDPATGLIYGQSDGAGGHTQIGGSPNGAIGFSEAKSATGYTSNFSSLAQGSALVTLAQNSGLLTLATVQLEAVGGAVYGVVYFPGPARIVNLPDAVLDLRCNVISLVGTSPSVLVSVS